MPSYAHTYEQSLKTDLKSSGALIGWNLKNRIIFEECASFLADNVQYIYTKNGTNGKQHFPFVCCKWKRKAEVCFS
jgi:hypothetical protein